MKEVSAGEFQREFGRIRSIAHREPVTITNHGRADVVLISHEQYVRYQEFERYAPTAVSVTELPDSVINQLGTESLSSRGDKFDDELDS